MNVCRQTNLPSTGLCTAKTVRARLRLGEEAALDEFGLEEKRPVWEQRGRAQVLPSISLPIGLGTEQKYPRKNLQKEQRCMSLASAWQACGEE